MLLVSTLKILIEKGFSRICSSHHVNNNSIIVSKLKRGFVIEGTTLSEMAGAMVNLVYIPSRVRKKIFDFRVGQLRPDDDIKRILKIR